MQGLGGQRSWGPLRPLGPLRFFGAFLAVIVLKTFSVGLFVRCCFCLSIFSVRLFFCVLAVISVFCFGQTCCVVAFVCPLSRSDSFLRLGRDCSQNFLGRTFCASLPLFVDFLG